MKAGTFLRWEELEDLLLFPWPTMDRRRLRVSLCLIDEGYRTDEVIEFCRSHKRIMPCKGVDKLDGLIDERRPEKQWGRMSKTAIGGLSLVRINTDYFKRFVQRQIHEETGDWQVCKNARDDYCRHMVSERRVAQRMPSGTVKYVWKATGPNHLFDTEVYNHAAAEYMGLAYKYQGEEPPERNVDRSVAIQANIPEVDDGDDWVSVDGEW